MINGMLTATRRTRSAADGCFTEWGFEGRDGVNRGDNTESCAAVARGWLEGARLYERLGKMIWDSATPADPRPARLPLETPTEVKRL
jgi:hypothetical protein